MGYFYSAQEKGFYLSQIHGDEIPQDSVEISVGLYEELLLGTQNGLIIIVVDGAISLVDPISLLSDEEKTQLKRERMPTLTPIEFDIKLNNAGLYDTVQDLIKDNFELRIAYNRATFFSRTDPFIDQARIALGLTNEQVDTIWESPLV